MDWFAILLLAAFSTAVTADVPLFEGDPCRFDNGLRGRCRLLKDCASVYREFLQGRFPTKTCGFTGFEPIICCPYSRENTVKPTTSTTPSTTWSYLPPQTETTPTTPKPPIVTSSTQPTFEFTTSENRVDVEPSITTESQQSTSTTSSISNAIVEETTTTTQTKTTPAESFLPSQTPSDFSPLTTSTTKAPEATTEQIFSIFVLKPEIEFSTSVPDNRIDISVSSTIAPPILNDTTEAVTTELPQEVTTDIGQNMIDINGPGIFTFNQNTSTIEVSSGPQTTSAEPFNPIVSEVPADSPIIVTTASEPLDTTDGSVAFTTINPPVDRVEMETESPEVLTTLSPGPEQVDSTQNRVQNEESLNTIEAIPSATNDETETLAPVTTQFPSTTSSPVEQSSVSPTIEFTTINNVNLSSPSTNNNNSEVSQLTDLLDALKDQIVDLESLIDLYNKTAKPVMRVIPGKPPISVSCQKCNELGERLCPRGTSKEPEGFPYVAAIGYQTEKSTFWLCSGALVSENFILTSAQCATESTKYGSPSVAKIGNLKLQQSYENEESKPQLHNIVQLIPHPLYKPPEMYHDIGLLRLEKPVIFNDYITQACLSPLPIGQGNDADVVVQTVGWKSADWGAAEGTKDFVSGEMRLMDYKSCNDSYLQRLFDPKMPRGVDDEIQICATTNREEDPCQFDIGGAIVQKNKEFGCVYDIIGVTRIRNLCGNDVLGVYTRVHSYLPWLESVIWSETSKN